MNVLITPSQTAGSIQPPASKSLLHRAIICASLADGISRLEGCTINNDIEATISCMKSFGARIEQEGTTLTIQGCSPLHRNKPAVLDCQESGSTLRFLIPMAALSSQTAVFTGSDTLLSRPMGVYADLFLSQNLVFDQSGQQIQIQGPLQPGLFQIPGNVSSQFISGLLFALPLLEEESEIAVLPPYESSSYVQLTLDMLKKFGIEIIQLSAHGYRIPGGQTYRPADLAIEADDSQAAFFAVLGALNHTLTIENLNLHSLQGDSVIFEDVETFGASLHTRSSSLTISPDRKKPTDFSLANCPDLGPILCVLQAYAPGRNRLTSASRLRYKESDRIAAMEMELRKWGVAISSTEDEILIEGKASYCAGSTVVIDSHNDHRIAMAMAIFGLCAQTPSLIENAQAVNKSYPHFFDDLKKLQAKVEIV